VDVRRVKRSSIASDLPVRTWAAISDSRLQNAGRPVRGTRPKRIRAHPCGLEGRVGGRMEGGDCQVGQFVKIREKGAEMRKEPGRAIGPRGGAKKPAVEQTRGRLG
jgi:hypothetical protein